MIAPLLLALAAPAAAPAAIDARPPRSTVIPDAGRGGLRDWRRGPGDDLFYVRDRTERWYLVRTTGPCLDQDGLTTLGYTTDPTGTFDLFSRITFGPTPQVVCSVRSIRRSDPPPGTGGKRRGAGAR